MVRTISVEQRFAFSFRILSELRDSLERTPEHASAAMCARGKEKRDLDRCTEA